MSCALIPCPLLPVRRSDWSAASGVGEGFTRVTCRHLPYQYGNTEYNNTPSTSTIAGVTVPGRDINQVAIPSARSILDGYADGQLYWEYSGMHSNHCSLVISEIPQ